MNDAEKTKQTEDYLPWCLAYSSGVNLPALT